MLLVTVVAQFTVKTINSEKALYFLSLMYFSINKVKTHMWFTCKNFTKMLCVPIKLGKKIFAPGNGGGIGVPPALPSFLYGPDLTVYWNLATLLFYWWLVEISGWDKTTWSKKKKVISAMNSINTMFRGNVIFGL